MRYDRYSSFLPEQGNPGTGPFATKNIFPYKGERQLPDLLDVRAARVGGLRPHRRGPRRGARQLRPLRRRQLGRVGESRARAPTDVNPNAIITRTYSNWDGAIPYVPVPGQPDVDDGRRHATARSIRTSRDRTSTNTPPASTSA